MFTDDPGTLATGHRTTRRNLLKRAGLAIGLVGLSGLAAACGATPAAAPTTAPKPTEVPPTPIPPPTVAPTATSVPQPTVAPTPTAMAMATPTMAMAPTAAAKASPTAEAAGLASIVNVEVPSANEFSYKLDRLEIPAGEVTFRFKNNGKLSHELMVYPQQDLTELLKLRRKGGDVAEDKYIKQLLGMLEDVDGGKGGDLRVKLTPGQYELSCTARGKNPDGSTFVHFDRGQFATLKVTPPNPAAATSPATGISVEMKGEEKGNWLFVPDKLVVPAGNVTFKVTNTMKDEHDFAVHQVGDVNEFVAGMLSGKMKAHDATHEMMEKVSGKELMEDLDGGKTDEKSMKLTPGLWVAACYMLSKAADGTSFVHRDRGQRFVFLVK